MDISIFTTGVSIVIFIVGFLLGFFVGYTR